MIRHQISRHCCLFYRTSSDVLQSTHVLLECEAAGAMNHDGTMRYLHVHAGLTCTPPEWNTMDMDPRLATSPLRRVISVLTRSMKVSRSVLTPLPLASTAKALHRTSLV